MRITTQRRPLHRFIRRQHRNEDDDEHTARPGAKGDDDDDDEDTKSTPTRTTTRRPTTTPTANAAAAKDDDDDEKSSVTSSPSASASPSSTRKSSSSSKSSSKGTKGTSTKSSGTHKSTTSTAHPTATLPASSAPESSSTRAIIGVGASVAAVLAVAVALWFLRKWFLKKHTTKYGAWRASVHDQLDAKRHTLVAPVTTASSEKDTNSLRPLMSDEKGFDTPISPAFPSPAISPPAPAGIPDSLRPVASPVTTAIPAPIISITSPTGTSPQLSTPSFASPPPTTATAAGVRREAAMVVRTFVPTLADELAVTIGDTVFIVEAFTDGWCSCETSGGQSGVVPLECLQSMSRQPRVQPLAQQDGGDWRTSKRHSSLYGGMRQSDTY